MSTFDRHNESHLRPENASSLVFAFATLAVVYYVGMTVYKAYFGPLAKFPGPPLRAWSKVPYIRSMVTGEDIVDYPALHKKYGPIVRVAPDTLHVLGSSQAWKDVYGFKTHSQPKPYKDPLFYAKPLNKVHSLIGADDANHTRQRKGKSGEARLRNTILSHSFSDKVLKDQEPMLKEWAAKLTLKLAERAGTGEHLDMLKYLNCTTFDIMGVLTFSESLNMLDDSEYTPWVKAIFGGIKTGTLIRGVKMYNWLTRYLVDQFVLRSKVVQRKGWEHWNYTAERADRRLKRTPERPDLWTKILERSDGPDGLSVEEHHSIAGLFMIAGTETTATALSGTIYHLLRNPSAMKRLAEEVRSAFPDFESITLDALAHQKYLMAVLQEGLRMYPPVPTALPRKVPKGGAAIAGEWVPEDTTISIQQFATYRSEDHFKHADEFHPERWLGDKEFDGDHLDALEPFSVGPRNCLGKNLAWHEMRLLLATVVLHFDLELCKESHDWSDQKVFTLWEKKPLMCTLTSAKA